MDGSLVGEGHFPAFSDSVSNNQSTYLTARIAADSSVHRDVYALRHASYLAYGYIDAMPDNLFSDYYDEVPTSKTILIYKQGVPVASARVTLYAPGSEVDGADSAPDSGLFHKEMTELMRGFRRHGRPVRAADISRLARHPDHIDDKDLTYASFRMIGYIVLHLNADVIFAAVRAHHLPFYRRMGFRAIAAPRPYPNLNFQPGLVAWTNPNPVDKLSTLPILDSVSIDDPEYEAFMAGEMVPVRSSAIALRMNRNRRRQNYLTGAALGHQDGHISQSLR